MSQALGKIFGVHPVFHHERSFLRRSEAVEISARVHAIQNALRDKLEARHVEVIDQSSLHEGHPARRAEADTSRFWLFQTDFADCRESPRSASSMGHSVN